MNCISPFQSISWAKPQIGCTSSNINLQLPSISSPAYPISLVGIPYRYINFPYPHSLDIGWTKVPSCHLGDHFTIYKASCTCKQLMIPAYSLILHSVNCHALNCNANWCYIVVEFILTFLKFR